MKRLPGQREERKREEERQAIMLIWLQEWPKDVVNVFTEWVPPSSQQHQPQQQPQQNGPADGEDLWGFFFIAATVTASALLPPAPVTLPIIGVYAFFTWKRAQKADN